MLRMIRVMLWAAFMLPVFVWAQPVTTKLVQDCLPSTVFSKQIGSDYVVHDNGVVSGRIGWCPADPLPGQTIGQAWQPYVHTFCFIGRTCVSSLDVWPLVDTIKNASDPVAAVRTLWATYGKPIVLDADKTQLKIWYVQACKKLIAAKVMTFSPDYTFPPDYCGIEPTAGPPPGPSYIVSASQAFPLNADGTRSIAAWAVAPVKGEPCDCSPGNIIMQYGARFCRVPSLSATRTVVAGCSVVK